MLIKLTHKEIRTILSGFYIPATSSYFNGHKFEKLRTGKVTISIKMGKKRQLIGGLIKEIGYESSQISSGYIEQVFIPNKPDKLRLILEKDI